MKNKNAAIWVALLLAGGLMLSISWLKGYSRDERVAADLAGVARAQAAEARTAPAPATTQPASLPASAAATTRPVSPPASVPPPEAPKRHKWKLGDTNLGDQKTFTAGDLDPASGYLFEVRFHRDGAAVSALKLSDTFATVADKQAWRDSDGDHAAYMEKVRASEGRLKGHYPLLNPVGKYRAYATRRIVVAEKDKPDTADTILLDRIPWRHEGTVVASQPAEAVEVTFSTTLNRHFGPSAAGAAPPALKITKTYVVAKGDYSLKMRLRVENLSPVSLEAYIDQLGPTGVPLEELYRGGDDRFLLYGKQKGEGGDIDVTFRMHDELQKGEIKVGDPIALGRSDDAEPVLWAGMSNKFFASMMYLEPAVPSPGQLAAPAWQADFHFLSEPESPTSNTHIPAVRIGGRRPKSDAFAHVPDMTLAPGRAPKEMTFDLFAGPKKRDMLSDASAPFYRPRYKELNYIGSINFRSCFCACNSLTLGMMWLLQQISRVTLGNYGLAIMILVVLVRLVLHPLTKKSQVNMMKMQKLGPEMERIRKKYAGDKEAMNREMMKFYKTQGSAPFLGCLPMFLQMPIWISLWGSLSVAVELRHAAFLPVWITDLAAPDVLVSWATPIVLPLIGGMTGPIHSFNLLPILLTVAMFFQTKLNPQMTGAGGAAPTKEQQTQQKMMKVMMPVMMLLIFYNAASGLTLYIMTSTFAGVIEQIYIRKHIEAQKAAEAAATTTVKVPGKAPRDARPKKPKGPMYFKKG